MSNLKNLPIAPFLPCLAPSCGFTLASCNPSYIGDLLKKDAAMAEPNEGLERFYGPGLFRERRSQKSLAGRHISVYVC